MRQVDEILLNALNILHDFVLLASNEFSPQKLHERFGEKAASVLRVGLVEDLKVDWPQVILVGFDELCNDWNEAFTPNNAMRANKEQDCKLSAQLLCKLSWNLERPTEKYTLGTDFTFTDTLIRLNRKSLLFQPSAE